MSRKNSNPTQKIVLMEYDFFINPASCFTNWSDIRLQKTPPSVNWLYVTVLGFYWQALFSCIMIGKFDLWKMWFDNFPRYKRFPNFINFKKKIIIFRRTTQRHKCNDYSPRVYNILDYIFTWYAFLANWMFSSFLSWCVWCFSRFGENLQLYAKSPWCVEIREKLLRNLCHSWFYRFCCFLGCFSLCVLPEESTLVCSISQVNHCDLKPPILWIQPYNWISYNHVF